MTTDGKPSHGQTSIHYGSSITGTTLRGDESLFETGRANTIGSQSTVVENDQSSTGAKDRSVGRDEQDDLLDVTSISSHMTTLREREAKTEIAHFLVSNQELRVLCSNIIGRQNKAKFADTGRKLLKSFYLALLDDAGTESEKQSVRLLKSQQGRIRISEQIAGLVVPAKTRNIVSVDDATSDAKTC